MFALAASNFSILSQTFVRQHAEKIAPGKSVFVSHGKFNGPPLPGPLLYGLRRFPKVMGGEFKPGALSFLQPRTRIVRDFLLAHGVTTMMAEFGTYGSAMLPAAMAADCKYYVHFHGWDASSVLRDKRYLRRYRQMFQQADGFFAPSQFIANMLIDVGCPKDAIWVTPCGVEVDQFPVSERRPNRCVAIGRFVEKKGPLTTVGAFAKATQNVPDAHLDFIGDGPLLDQAIDLAKQLGATERITFHGAQPHQAVQDIMSQSSLFLQHSVTAADGNVEGLPVAVLEAMCAGLAVVSTYHSGIPEAVDHANTGFLVAEHDEASMANRIAELMADPAMVSRMGDAGRVRAIEQFSIDRSIRILRDKMGLTDLLKIA